MYRHHGTEPVFFDERATDNCLDADSVEHLRTRIVFKLHIDIAHHQDLVVPQLRRSTGAEYLQLIRPHGGRASVGVVMKYDEFILVRRDLGIGTP